MSTIHLEHRHTLPSEEAVRRAHEVIGQLAERIKAEIRWEGDNTAVFKGSGFSGKAKLEPNQISLDVDLGMLLRPLKGKIEERIGQTLEKRFT
jgi:putative polyhydroxyalkanoate system protein